PRAQALPAAAPRRGRLGDDRSRRQAPARRQRPAGTPLRGDDRRPAGPARRAIPPHPRARGRHGRAGRPADARARQPRDGARGARVGDPGLRRTAPRAGRGRLRHLRRRPAPSLRESHRRGVRLPGGRLRGAEAELDASHSAIRADAGTGPHKTHPTRLPQAERAMTMAQTMFEKIWQAHEVAAELLYIDLHLVHEVTSPQAFDGLRLAGRSVRRPDRTLATADHNTPTDGTPVAARIKDELSRVQVQTLERNCEEFGIPVYSLGSERQGIVHVIGPELGVTQPGMTIVC